MIIKPDLPVSGLSIHAAATEELEGFQKAGFNEYVLKPVSFAKLIAALKTLLKTERPACFSP